MNKMKKYGFIIILSGVVLLSGCRSFPELKPSKIKRETVRLKPHAAVIAEAVEGQELTGDTAADWIALLRSANAASVPFNPYAVPVGAGLTVLSTALGLFARRKSKEAANSQAKYKSHKEGVEMTLKQLKAEKSDQAGQLDKQLYENIGVARQRHRV